MSYFTFKEFFRFHTALVFWASLAYLLLISIIMALCVIIHEQKQMIVLLEKEVNRKYSDTYIHKPKKNKLLERSYKVRLR